MFAVLDKSNNPILLQRQAFMQGNISIDLKELSTDQLNALNIYRVKNLGSTAQTGVVEGQRIRVDHAEKVVYIEQLMVSNQFGHTLNLLKNSEFLSEAPKTDAAVADAQVQEAAPSTAEAAPSPSENPPTQEESQDAVA